MTTRDLTVEDREGWVATSEEVQRWRRINAQNREPPRDYFDPHRKFRRTQWIVIGLVYAAAGGFLWWVLA